jgi:hypothetical protein
MGVDDGDIRTEPVRLRYAIGLCLFGCLNVFLLYLLGSRLFGSRSTGLAAAALWAVTPTTLAYATFAQDTFYNVFFTAALWLTWETATAERRAWLPGLALGCVFFVMTMTNYSWCIATTIFAVFIGLCAWRSRWNLGEIALRFVLPLALMTVLLGATLWHYRLNYLNAYRVSSAYVDEWYRFTGPYQWIMALVGGQLEMLLMMGSVAGSAFLLYIGRRAAAPDTRESNLSPYVFVLVILAVYAIPILIGPNCLKMETSRCWNWVLSVPVAAAAHVLTTRSRARLYLAVALSVSAFSFACMRLFLDFAP